MKNTAQNEKKINIENEITTLANGVGVAIFGKFFGRALHVVTQIAIARLLGPAKFGIFAIAWSLVRILESIGPLGMKQAAVRFGAEFWDQGQEVLVKTVGKILGIAAFLALAWGCIFYLGAPLLSTLFSKPSLRLVLSWAAWLIPLGILLQVTAAITRASKRMKFATIGQDIGQPFLSLAAILFFILLGEFTLHDAVLVEIVSYAGALTLTSYFLYQILFKKTEKRETASTVNTISSKRILSFALPSSLLGIFGALTVWGGRLMVGYFLPASEMGIYQALTQVSVSFVMVLSGINAIFSPMVAALNAQNKMEQLAETFRVATKWGLYLALPVFLIIMIFPGEVLETLFGKDYLPGVTPLLILAVAQLVNVATGPVGFMLVMTDRQVQWMWITASALLVNIFGGIALIPRWGLKGAAIASASATIWMFSIGLYRVYRDIHLWPYDRRFLKGGISALITAIALLILRNLLSINALPTLLFVIPIALVIFFGVLWVCTPDEEDMMLLSTIKYHWDSITRGKF